MKKLALLSTDTAHHRYFINKLKQAGINFEAIVFETTGVKAPFETGPFYAEEERDFEAREFFKDVREDISGERIFKVENINSPEAVEFCQSLDAEFGIVFGNRKLKAPIIEAFKDGLCNVHRGIAQAYKGLDSDLWAIYHNDIGNIGVTIHRVDLELDTGEIIEQAVTPIPADAEMFHLRYLTSVTATELSEKALKSYLDGTLKSTPQKGEGRYYSFMPLSIKQTLVKKFKRLIAQ